MQTEIKPLNKKTYKSVVIFIFFPQSQYRITGDNILEIVSFHSTCLGFDLPDYRI